MPNMTLNVNVTPREAVSERVGLASGTDMRIAAGTAIYDALAANVANIPIPPTEKPNISPILHPITADNKGIRIPKNTKKMP